MVLISSKFISDLKECAELDIRLKEFNSFAGMKKIEKIKLPKTEQKSAEKKRRKLTKKL
jgi:hypothetical protein